MTKPENPPAFPTEPNTQPGFYVHHGMTLRDWFAGQALSGALSSIDNPLDLRPVMGQTWKQAFANDVKRRAQWCYAQADAMLAARENTGGEND